MVDKILQYALGAPGLLFLVLGYFSRHRRWSFWTASICALSAAIAAHYSVFWVLAIFSLGAVWALVCALPFMDFAWRLKTGFVTAMGLGAFLCVWPTLDGVSDGKIHCPAYIHDNVPFKIVAGLDLRVVVGIDEGDVDDRNLVAGFLELHLLVEAGELFARGRLVTAVQAVHNRQLLAHLVEVAIALVLDRLFHVDGINEPLKMRPEIESRFRESAVNQAKDTINRRVDELGLREAAVTVRDEDIIIEVPGEDERTFKEIRDIISQTARLEFKMLDDGADFFGQVAQKFKGADLPAGLTLDGAEQVSVGLDKQAVTHYAFIKKQPGESMKETRARLAEWVSTLNVPDDHEVGYEVHRTRVDDVTMRAEEDGWRTYYLYGKADITGDMLQDAQAVPDQSNKGLGGWYVALTFTPSGGDRFEEVTGANVKRRFAIILDGKVESAPVIRQRIAGGRASITLGASDTDSQLEEARKLELVLRSGALPAPISPSNEQRIGPSLGKDAIGQGVKGALAGSLLVLVFMVVYYHRAGAVADIAVLFNLLLQLAVLASFGASMTLPGIAGLALTIGMAVDANVLINERIREELRAGKSPRAAVDAGYEKAFSAILDGHVTTFISGLILAQYGTGPIKGFAVTLIVGIMASLFTGVVCTRLVFDWWVRGRRIKTLNIG